METNVSGDESAHAKPLYRLILGEAWWDLHEVVRTFHATTPIHGVGTFRVRHGRNWLVRALAWLARLPAAGEAVDVQLAVTSWGDGEEWRRRFAGRPMVTWQYERRGLLVERMGLTEIRLRLQAVEGGLAYESTSAALCLGPLRVPLPAWFRPRVTALEKAGAGNHIDVLVEVCLPLLGCLVAYEGKLTRVEAQA